VLVARRGADPPPRELAARDREHAQHELCAGGPVRAGAWPAPDQQASPAVALTARHARTDRCAELARERLGEPGGGVKVLVRPGVQRARVHAFEQLCDGAGRQHRRAQVVFDAAVERLEEPDRVQRQDRRELPALTALSRREEQPDRPLHALHRRELLAGERQPRRRCDPPAAQVAGLERVGVAEQPARQVAGLLAGESKPGSERPALVVAVGVDGRVVERDRQPRVGAPQRCIELGRRDVEPCPVEARVAVGARLAVDQSPHRVHRQPRAVESGDAVATQHDLRVCVGAAPAVGVVRVHRLAGGEPCQRPPAQLLQHSRRARAATPQLFGGAGVSGLLEQSCALELLRWGRAPAAVERQGPRRDGRVLRRVFRAGGGVVMHLSLL
jgi:hypothetical protein